MPIRVILAFFALSLTGVELPQFKLSAQNFESNSDSAAIADRVDYLKAKRKRDSLLTPQEREQVERMEAHYAQIWNLPLAAE